jgi:hypothetical protein
LIISCTTRAAEFAVETGMVCFESYDAHREVP